MPLSKQIIEEINRANAQHSTGPKSVPGKQRSSMNAMKHNLSGQNLILMEAETEAYNRMAGSMLNDLNPKSEPERQIAQKIIDTNFRLNRLTAIENNMFSFGLTANETDLQTDDRIEVMAAQTRAWIEHAHSFDTLGRYESRLSRQLHKYQEEFERLQTERRKQEVTDKHRSAEEIERDKFDPASFGPISNTYRILTHLPPPKTSPFITNQTETGNAGDLDQERSRMVSLVQDKVAFQAAPVANGELEIPGNDMAA